MRDAGIGYDRIESFTEINSLKKKIGIPLEDERGSD
jgi:hypothetical protein